MKRPSYFEIHRKIKLAKESIFNNNFSILKPKVVTPDALGLGILMEELDPLLIDLLNRSSLVRKALNWGYPVETNGGFYVFVARYVPM